jgi:hypothetical protein
MRNPPNKERSVQFALGICALATSLSVGSSCSLDPVHDGEVKALGGEDPNVPVGQYHRAGQPCTVCHGGEGPAKNSFSLAGTIYYQAFDGKQPLPVDQAYVRIIDDTKAEHCFVTNCMGNFFARPDVFGQKGLVFPILVSVQKDNGKNASPIGMVGHIGRESSCANCHKDPPFFDSPGHIAVNQQAPANMDTCPPAVEPDPPPQCPEGPN